MSITVGDILKVVAVMQWLDGDIAQNVFSVVVGGTGGPFDELDVVDDLEDWLDDMYANMTSLGADEIDGSELRVYIYDSIDDDYDEVGSGVWAWNPTSADHQLPRGVAALINAKTINPDVNGKKYLPGMVETSSDDGLWNTAMMTALVLFAVDWTTTFVGAASGATFVPGVWSPTRTTFFAFSGTEIIPTIPAYQRRRKRGVGI